MIPPYTYRRYTEYRPVRLSRLTKHITPQVLPSSELANSPSARHILRSPAARDVLKPRIQSLLFERPLLFRLELLLLDE